MTWQNYSSLFLHGIFITLSAWIITALSSLVIGTCFGILSCNHLGSAWMKASIRIYTFIAKGVPAYVQILIAYFILPSLLGISLPGFIAACGALAFCSSGYVTEIVRSGINSIHKGQWNACLTLGYPLHAQLRYIILPQAFQHCMAALFGEGEQLLKSTSLLATIGITELTRTGMNIISRELNPVPIYFSIAAIYLLFSACLQLLLLYFEKRFSHGRR